MSGLRFCMVTTFYPPYHFGGDAIAVQRLARALVRAGHDVTVVHDTDAYHALRPEGREAAPPPAPDDGVRVEALRSRFATLSTLLTQQTGRPVVHGRQLRRVLAPGRFDVVHFHNVSLVGGPGVLGMGDDAVRLYTAHEHWLVCPTHVLWRHRREPCDARQCLRCTIAHRRPPQLWRMTGLLERETRHVDAFIAMSEFSRAKHREFGFARDMEVLPGFLPDDGPNDRPDDVGASPHARPYFLYVGRLERLKGLDETLPVLRSHADADLLIAGDGAHGDVLRAKAAGDPRIRFLGRVSGEALGAYYAHAIAVLAPSVGYETFGLTLIEAFRHGTPVIARRRGPFPEIVERAGAGLLFSDDVELADALRRCQYEPTLRRTLGDAARRAYQEHWSERAVLPRYLDIVRRAALRRGHTRVAAALSAELPSLPVPSAGLTVAPA